MRRSATAAAVMFVVAACGHMAGGEKEAGWVTLLDASTLGNWNRTGAANWRVVDGAVVADKGVGFLVTKETYGDFELRAEFYAEADTNSGIYFRCQDAAAPANATCYEANIYDTRAKAEYGTGAFTNLAAVSDPKPKAGGRWNTYHLTVKGDHMVLVMNGQKTAEGRDAKHARGFIGLQHDLGVKGDTSPVKFRKVEIRPL
jgi:hypothetical protein